MQDPSLYENTLQPAQPEQPEVQFPEQEQLPCPRCDSTNTKFCYYNNYNLCQPRYFCRACRRHWTKGGTLRNIPIGGGGGGAGGSKKTSKRNSTAKQRPSTSKNKNLCNFEGQNGNIVSSAVMERQFGGFVESNGGGGSGTSGLGVSVQFGHPGSGPDAGPGMDSSHQWW